MLKWLMRFSCLLALALPLALPLAAQTKPWPVKVVIVTTFEIGEDTGDRPGEFQFWVERNHLDRKLDFPGGLRPLRTNADHSIVGIVSGTALNNAATSLMALGLDPRFDFTHAYWLVNGIAGVDPADASMGSAAWARYVIGDISRYIDPREAPADWPYGYFPIGSGQPNEAPGDGLVRDRTNAYTLNAALAEWAFDLTQGTQLLDTAEMAAFRKDYVDYPNAQRAPFVLLGDSFASDTFWHGKISTQYANDWAKLFTGGRANFVMTNMEDAAFAEALRRLDQMHRADFNRLLVLRTASNYCLQRPGHAAAESVNAPYVGFLPAVENAWRVSNPVVEEIVRHWSKWKAVTPASGGAHPQATRGRTLQSGQGPIAQLVRAANS